MVLFNLANNISAIYIYIPRILSEKLLKQVKLIARSSRLIIQK
ncbi:hypothetical protein LUTEI9C_140268 [Luteimonas sp. 9C]|nr:hypothetical protein LUTEI9C_140268 [Luteimonas sp. 9C]